MRALCPPLFAALLLAGCDCGGGSTGGDLCRSSAECTPPEMCIEGRCEVPTDGGPGDDVAVRPLPDGGPVDGGTCAISSGEAAALPVDIIIAVDQSASTNEENAAIAANINTNLVDILEASGLDYRVIIINSSAMLCPDPPLADPADCLADNPPRYYRVAQGVNNSDALTLILWTYGGQGKRPNSCVRTAQPELAWRDHLRFDAIKVFLVFSDDDPATYQASGAPPDCGGGGAFAGCTNPACPTLDCPGMDWASICPNFGCPTFADRAADWPGGRDFPTELYALDPPGMFGTAAEPKWVFHSLVGLSSQLEPTEPVTGRCDTCSFSGNTAEAAGVEYQKLSVLTGGLRFPSCNTDYSPVFRRIASTIVPIACEFLVESTGIGDVDPAATNVELDPGDGTPPITILQDSTRDCDTDADGWQWTDGTYTRIRLCGPACDMVQAAPDGTVRITVGCETMIRPPI